MGWAASGSGVALGAVLPFFDAGFPDPMPHRIDDARQWRVRAEEARGLAERLANPEARRIMLGIAVSYAALAQMAEDRDVPMRRRRELCTC